MKKWFGLVLAVVLANFAYSAQLQTVETMKEALTAARQKDGYVLMFFTGTDWCTACIHLKDKILSTDEFVDKYGDRFVMTTVDFPRLPALRAKISKEEAARREELLNAFKARGLPTAVIFDAGGYPFAIINGARPTVADYAKEIDAALEIRVQRDAKLAAAQGLTGMARATALAEALNLLPEPCRNKYPALVQEINLLDPENTLGYRDVLGKSEAYVKQMAELNEITSKFVGRFEREQLLENNRIIDAFLARTDLEPEIRQHALRVKGDTFAFLRDVPNMIKTYEEAVAAAPKTDMARRLQNNINFSRKQMEEREKAKKEKENATQP